jgi:hypothetical protein
MVGEENSNRESLCHIKAIPLEIRDERVSSIAMSIAGLSIDTGSKWLMICECACEDGADIRGFAHEHELNESDPPDERTTVGGMLLLLLADDLQAGSPPVLREDSSPVT